MPTKQRRPCTSPGCPRLQPCDEHARHKRPGQTYADRKAEPGRAWYSSAQWRTKRLEHLKAFPFCVECERERRLTLGTDVDHRIPHRGDAALFWDLTNWQTLCGRHHSAKTAREVNERTHEETR